MDIEGCKARDDASAFCYREHAAVYLKSEDLLKTSCSTDRLTYAAQRLCYMHE